MTAIVQFAVHSVVPHESNGTMYEFKNGRIRSSEVTPEKIMIGNVFACEMTIGEDRFDFQLYNSMNPYLLALQSMLSTVLNGTLPKSEIDIPDYDVSFSIEKLTSNEFLMKLTHGDKVVSSYAANAGLIRASIDALPVAT